MSFESLAEHSENLIECINISLFYYFCIKNKEEKVLRANVTRSNFFGIFTRSRSKVKRLIDISFQIHQIMGLCVIQMIFVPSIFFPFAVFERNECGEELMSQIK